MHTRPHDVVLDLGCGTATLAIALATAYPGVAVIGLDADARALAIGQDKARRAGAAVHFEHGYSSCMIFPDAYFDRVVSSLFFHHPSHAHKAAMLSEVKRVLKPGGELHIAESYQVTLKSSRGESVVVGEERIAGSKTISNGDHSAG